MSTERLIGLVRDAAAAGVPQTPENLAHFAAQRAPDLAEAARAFGDLAQRGLVAHLDNNAIATQEDAPIAADLSARLGVSPANAQMAIAAARGLSQGGASAGGPAVASPYQPPAAGGAAPAAEKLWWQQWWVWALVAGAALLLYSVTQKKSPQTGPATGASPTSGAAPVAGQVPLDAPTDQPPAAEAPSGPPTMAAPSVPQGTQGPEGMTPMVGTDMANLPTSNGFSSRGSGQVIVTFSYPSSGGVREALVRWSRTGGPSTVAIAKPGVSMSDPAAADYMAHGVFEPGRTREGKQIFLFKPTREYSKSGGLDVRISFGLDMTPNGGRRGDMLCVFDRSGTDIVGCGYLPNAM